MQNWLNKQKTAWLTPRGGGTDLERGHGDVRPLFTPLLLLTRVPFQAKESVHKTSFWDDLEILACTASIFTQILIHKPPNLEIFSSHAPKFGNFPLTSPPFQRQMSVRKPHTSEIRAAHPYLKKKNLSAPPRGWHPYQSEQLIKPSLGCYLAVARPGLQGWTVA